MNSQPKKTDRLRWYSLGSESTFNTPAGTKTLAVLREGDILCWDGSQTRVGKDIEFSKGSAIFLEILGRAEPTVQSLVLSPKSILQLDYWLFMPMFGSPRIRFSAENLLHFVGRGVQTSDYYSMGALALGCDLPTANSRCVVVNCDHPRKTPIYSDHEVSIGSMVEGEKPTAGTSNLADSILVGTKELVDLAAADVLRKAGLNIWNTSESGHKKLVPSRKELQNGRTFQKGI